MKHTEELCGGKTVQGFHMGGQRPFREDTQRRAPLGLHTFNYNDSTWGHHLNNQQLHRGLEQLQSVKDRLQEEAGDKDPKRTSASQ